MDSVITNSDWEDIFKLEKEILNMSMNNTTSVEDYLINATEKVKDRGEEYDKGHSNERSMAATVTAFNAISGSMMSEQEGWLFMQVLKSVRLHTNPSSYHEDSAIDKIAYAALEAECWSKKHH